MNENKPLPAAARGPAPCEEEAEALDPRNYEPGCTCARVDVDLYDARGCELCDPQSEWNRQCRALDYQERLRKEAVTAECEAFAERKEIDSIWTGITDSACPF